MSRPALTTLMRTPPMVVRALYSEWLVDLNTGEDQRREAWKRRVRPRRAQGEGVGTEFNARRLV